LLQIRQSIIERTNIIAGNKMSMHCFFHTPPCNNRWISSFKRGLNNIIPPKQCISIKFRRCKFYFSILGVGVKMERIWTDSSETIFVIIFFSDSESGRIVCGYEYGIRVYR
jgi:hypothetical protein